MSIRPERLEEMLQAFQSLRIGLLGDLFLDRYLQIEPGVVEMSIETGLEAYQVSEVRNSPGALGTVMNNLSALGIGSLVPISVVGDDGHGYDLLQELAHHPAQLDYLIRDPHRLTPTYTKPMKQNAQGEWVELNRIDVRTRSPIRDRSTATLAEYLRNVFPTLDGLIVLDQVNETNWGVVNSTIKSVLKELGQQSERLIFVDSRAHIATFEQCTLKGNRSEFLAATDEPDESPEVLQHVTAQLARTTGRSVFCTLGDQGISVTRKDGSVDLAAGIPAEGPVDIVGAGDSATSGIVASLLSGASEVEAAAVGNLVASITVQKLGTTGTASPAELRTRAQQLAE